MKGRLLQRDLDVPAQLRSGDRAPLPIRLGELRVYEPQEGRRAILLALSVDYQGWRRIDAEQWFGFTLDSLAPDVQSYQITSGRPVELEVGLQEPYLSELTSLPDGEAVLDRLAAGLTGSDDALLDGSAWRWLGVFQEQQAGATTFKRGFRSAHWATFRPR